MSVTIYTIENCPHCEAAKEFFKENNVEYTEYDVNKSDERWHEAMDHADGNDIVPVVVIEHHGHEHSFYGRFEDIKPKLEQALSH